MRPAKASRARAIFGAVETIRRTEYSTASPLGGDHGCFGGAGHGRCHKLGHECIDIRQHGRHEAQSRSKRPDDAKVPDIRIDNFASIAADGSQPGRKPYGIAGIDRPVQTSCGKSAGGSPPMDPSCP